ncbi:COP9 signalosome complex subunit 7b-like [Actinia tenebrosa]|uniref:COP9 signalosome complex subunit 7b-like n=1 Tax=Actinia tenebrosa TaxID=6105 RepID=A0A6P8JGV0_ACTTE|nr:COP9 signalosome complex subunit 7b-like [Actinia tenebrosa]
MSEKESKGHSNAHHSHQLEQFVLLAKSARGAGLTALINQVIEAPGVHVFGELLEMSNVQELSKTEDAPYWQLLNIFAFGTYSDYKANISTLPELSPIQQKKLRHLTIVSLSAKSKFIPYQLLLEELDISNLRELEDLIIEAIYADIIHGKLDQKNKQVEVEYALGRDIKPETVSKIADILQEWCDSCDSVLSSIDKQIHRANLYREKKVQIKKSVETEVESLKKAIKATSQTGEMEEEGDMGVGAYQSQQYQQKSASSGKQKGHRVGGKVFGSQVRR